MNRELAIKSLESSLQCVEGFKTSFDKEAIETAIKTTKEYIAVKETFIKMKNDYQKSLDVLYNEGNEIDDDIDVVGIKFLQKKIKEVDDVLNIFDLINKNRKE